MKEFTKDDLKTGMLVECRNGDISLIINDTIVGTDDFKSTLYLNHDLTHQDFDGLDIIKVSNVKLGNKLMPRCWTLENINNDLMWDRNKVEEPMYMTMHGKKYKLSEVE